MSISELDLWRLSDELSVVDVALLAAGHNPGEVRPFGPDPMICPIESIQSHEDYGRHELADQGFRAVFKALRGAVFRNKISARMHYRARLRGEMYDAEQCYPESDNDSEIEVKYEIIINPKIGHRHCFLGGAENIQSSEHLRIIREPNWHETTVDVEDVRYWFAERGVHPPFFFPNGIAEGFRNRQHPRYSPKLACAVAAWEAIEKPQPNKSVKQSLEAWVVSNGVNFGMGGDDNTVTQTAAGEVAKVANWNPKGGATPTAIAVGEEPKPIENYTVRSGYAPDLDDEIPF